MTILEAIGHSILHILWQSAIVYGIFMLIYRKMQDNHAFMYRLAIGVQSGIFALFISNIIYFNNASSVKYLLYTGLLHSFNTSKILIYVSVFYFLFLIVQICVSTFQYLRLNKKIHSAENRPATEWINFTQEWITKLNISRKINIIGGDKFSSPFTKGFLKPIIYLPLSIFTNLTPLQIEAIILHELVHIKKYDYLIILIQNTIDKILYFNPFVLLIGNIARKEREILCDDLVTQYYDKLHYSDALYTIAKYNERHTATASAKGNSENELLERIKVIHKIKADKPKLNIAKISVTILSILLIYIVLPLEKSSVLVNYNFENNIQLTPLKQDIRYQHQTKTAKLTESLSHKTDLPETIVSKEKLKLQQSLTIQENIIESKLEITNDIQHIVNYKKELIVETKEPVIEKFTSDTTKQFSLEIIARTNSEELEAAFKKINNLFSGEKLQYQVENVSNIFTTENNISTAYYYLITDNYIVEIEQNFSFTRIKLSENKHRESLNKLN